MTTTDASRSERARIAAYSLHAKYDARQTTRRARAAFLARFESQVDPDRTLPEPERLRRAEGILPRAGGEVGGRSAQIEYRIDSAVDLDVTPRVSEPDR